MPYFGTTKKCSNELVLRVGGTSILGISMENFFGISSSFLSFF